MNLDWGCWPYLDMTIQPTGTPRPIRAYESQEPQEFKLTIDEKEKEFLLNVCTKLKRLSNKMQATAYGDTELSPEKLEALIKKIYEAKGE